MSMTETMRLYDLAGAEPDRRFSPYCWRTRLALAHKNLSVETIPWRFTEKDEIAASGQTLVPVLVDGGQWIADSWTIANYLEDKYPNSSSLFGGNAGRSLDASYSDIADGLVQERYFRLSRFDVLQHVAEKDRDYFGKAGESGRMARLEAVVSDRGQAPARFRANLAPLRLTLKSQPFFGGDQPLYADYAVFRSVAVGALHQSFCPSGEGRSDQAVARSLARLFLTAWDATCPHRRLSRIRQGTPPASGVVTAEPPGAERNYDASRPVQGSGYTRTLNSLGCFKRFRGFRAFRLCVVKPCAWPRRSR